MPTPGISALENKSLVSRPKGSQPPIQLLGLAIREERLEQWTRQIQGDVPPPDIGNAEVDQKVTGQFEDGFQVDARLVATDQAPYLDLVLLGPDGAEIGAADPTVMPDETVTFRVVSETRYRAGFLPLPKGARATPGQNPYSPATPYRCGSCHHRSWRAFLPVAEDVGERVAPGGTFTDKECPECGALMYPNPTPIEKQVIQAQARRMEEDDVPMDVPPLNAATRELKAEEATALIEGPLEKQMQHIAGHLGLKELLSQVGELREVDDPEFVVVWSSPHAEDTNLPWIWRPKAFVSWFNDVMVSEGQPSADPKRGGQWAGAARTLEEFGYEVHVC